MTLPPIGAKAVLDLRDWERNYRKVIGDSTRLEGSFGDVVNAADRVEDALADIRGDVDVSVRVSDNGVDQIRRRIDDLQSEVIDLRTDVDDAPLQTAARIVDDLDSEAVSIPIDVQDEGLTSAQRAVDGLDSEAVDVKINVDAPELKTLLTDLRKLAAIDLAINVVGNLPGILAQLQSIPGIGTLLEGDAAAAALEARTSLTKEQARAAIDSVYAQNYGTTREEIAGVIAELTQAGVAYRDLEDAAVAAYQVASINGEDVNQIIRAQASLIRNGLAGDWRDAADVLQTGFASGANRGDDLLDTLIEYGSTFDQLGLTAGETLNVINTGLTAGIDNSDRIADLLRETSLRALNPEETAAQDALERLGFADEAAAYQAGELTGSQFMAGLMAALRNVENGGERQALAASILGTQAEDFSVQAVLGIDPLTQTFDTIEDRAAQAATAFNDTLGSTVTEFFRSAQISAEQFLSSDQIDLDGKIEYLKTRLQEVNRLLGSGMQLDQAIEIAFQIPGFSTGIDRIESILGNFVLMLSDIAASIATVAGNSALATTIRASAEPLASNQLNFDLGLAGSEEEIRALVSTAVARGVSSEEISAALQGNFERAVEGGSAALAQDIASVSTDLVRADRSDIDELEALNAQIATLRENLDAAGANEAGLFSNEQFADISRMRTDLEALETRRDALLATVPLDFDTTTMVERAEKAAAEARAAWEDAFNTGDVAGMTAAAGALNDPALMETARTAGEQYRAVFDQAVTAGDVSLAQRMAEHLGDPMLLQQAQALALTVNAIGRSPEGVAAPTTLDVLLLDLFRMRDEVAINSPLIDTGLMLVETAFGGIYTSATGSLPPTREAIVRLAEAVVEHVSIANEVLEDFIGNLQEVALFANIDANAATGGASGGGGGSGGGSGSPAAMTQSRDSGGAVMAGVPYLVNGEIFVPHIDSVALGLARSQSLLAQMGGGLMTSIDQSRTSNVQMQNNYYVANEAQANASASSVADRIRGF